MNIRLAKRTYHIGRISIICFLAIVISVFSMNAYVRIKQVIDETPNINISSTHQTVNHQPEKVARTSYNGITSPKGRYQCLFSNLNVQKHKSVKISI